VPGSRLQCRAGWDWHARGDGTTALFFTPELLSPLVHGAGFRVDEMRYDRRLAVNRATQERMYRVWLVAVLRKPDASFPQPMLQLRVWRPWLRVAVAAVVAAALMRRMQASPGLARLLSATCTRRVGAIIGQ